MQNQACHDAVRSQGVRHAVKSCLRSEQPATYLQLHGWATAHNHSFAHTYDYTIGTCVHTLYMFCIHLYVRGCGCNN